MTVLLGCIADDFTGATDLAGTLVKHGMRTVQTIGVPRTFRPERADAVVVALKTRTSPPEDAVARSLEALAWLQSNGARQYYFKYCSTFDSTDQGNIGPVTDALMDALSADFTVACPAFPANGRTVYQGHLFVGDALLSESGMRSHPLTPMTDANLVRVLGRQTARRVGLVDHSVVARGAQAVVERFATLRSGHVAIAVLDALDDAELRTLGEACANLTLVTGGSGLASGLPQNFRAHGLLSPLREDPAFVAPAGGRAVIAGSCSSATQCQVALMAEKRPALRIDPMALADDRSVASRALEWARTHIQTEPVLIYATANAEDVGASQTALGAGLAGSLVEQALADIAVGLTDIGVTQLIVAGGETSGAVVKALGVEALQIGPEIDPGVPWTIALGGRRALALALKSGNFGTPDFFMKAWNVLSEPVDA